MRRLLLSFALALALSALGASSALAEAPEGAQKAPLYGPAPTTNCGTGAEPTAKTFGSAVLNTPGNEMTLSGEVSLKRAAPNTTYDIEVVEVTIVGCSETSAGTITTNKKGNGNDHINVARSVFGEKFWVEIELPGEEEPEFASPAVELD
jgi:hypothetical protein